MPTSTERPPFAFTPAAAPTPDPSDEKKQRLTILSLRPLRPDLEEELNLWLSNIRRVDMVAIIVVVVDVVVDIVALVDVIEDSDGDAGV